MGKAFDEMIIGFAGEASKRMADAGYSSVFERIEERQHSGPKITVLWINLQSGESKLTVTQQRLTQVLNVTPDYEINHEVQND